MDFNAQNERAHAYVVEQICNKKTRKKFRRGRNSEQKKELLLTIRLSALQPVSSACAHMQRGNGLV